MKRLVVFLAVVFFAVSSWAARLEVSTGDPVEIHIAVGVPTVVTFTEEIKSIPTSADPGALSLEIEGKRLFIQSLREGFSATLFVVGQSGRLHLLRLVEHDPPDTEVQLILPQAPPRFEEAPPAVSGRPGRARRPQGNAMRRLLVAMLKGDKLPGVEVLAHSQSLASSKEVEIQTTHLYAAGRYLGFPRHGAQPDRGAVRAAPAGVPGAGPEGHRRGPGDDSGGRGDAGVPGYRAGIAVLREIEACRTG